MPRRSAAQPKPEPASLPEVLIPPSQASDQEREAYWLNLLSEPENLKNAVQTEDFWPMIQDFPSALWTGNRLSLYLYRREDDSGLSIKNAEGKKKYIKIFHGPIDEEFITRNFGGGKFTLYLKLDNKLTLTEFTFWTDGIPKAQPGQVVEMAGKEVQVSGQSSAAAQPSDATALMETSSKATEKSMEILADAAKSSIAMVREQAASAAAPPRNQLDDLKTLLEIVRQPAATPDPVQQELMKQIIAKAFAEPKAPAEVEEKETPIENTLAAIEKLTGGKSLVDLLKPAARAEAADPVASWGPIVTTVGGILGQIFEKLPILQAQRNDAMRLEIHLRQMQLSQPGQPLPQLAAPPPAPNPPPQAVQPQPATVATLDPAQLMAAIVRHIVAGFKKPPVGEWGEETAAAMGFHFSDAIDAMGIADTLGDPEKVRELIAGIPEFTELRKDARWEMYEEDFLAYSKNRWSLPPDEDTRPPAA